MAAKRITGKLSKRGYTVIALSADGRAKSVVARRGKFRLTPKAARVTLHLRGRDGVYGGPVVVRAQGRRAVLGVKAGARLGKVVVRRRYARPARRLAGKWVDDTRTARARRGVPIGAGRFGRVRSKAKGTSVPGDRDRDGIPDRLDIDDDGDLVLDNLDRSGVARAAQIVNEFVLVSGIDTRLEDTVNANATALTTEDVDEALSTRGSLKIRFVLGDLEELDCRGLVYCSLGGTGSVQQQGQISDYPPFPDCCDPDGDGFGTLQPQAKVRDAMVLHHGATTAQIGTGDVLIERVTTNGVETQYPAVVPYVFATVPALVAYDDGRGNSATVTYPYTFDPALKDGFPVAAGPNGDVVMKLTFWRPQRRPIPPEPGDWIDIGGLDYSVGMAPAEGSCPKRALSESDPNLTRIALPAPPGQEAYGFRDLAGDQAASPANTFTYTVNLTECLSAVGLSFNQGESRTFGFAGATPGGRGGNTGQTLSFKRE